MDAAFSLLLLLGPWTIPSLLLALAIFTIVVGAQVPQMLVYASLACYAALMVNPALVTIPGAVDLRLLAVGMVVFLVVVRGRWPRPRMLTRGAFPASMVFYGIGFLTLGTAVDFGDAKQALLAGILSIIFVWFLLAAAEPDEIRSALHGISGFILVGSFAYVVVDPVAAKALGRWSGIVANANTLGAFAAFFLLTAKQTRAIWSLPATALALIGSASRSSAFASGLVAGPRLVEGRSRRLRRFVFGIGLVVAVPIIRSVFFSAEDATGTVNGLEGGNLARTGNSRAEFWSEGWNVFVHHLTTGVGLGNEPPLLSSSVISPFVQIGLAAAIPLVMIIALSIRRARGPRTLFRPILAFLMVHGIFEMWLFAGGSLIFVLFLIVAYDPSLDDIGGTEEEQVAVDDDVGESNRQLDRFRRQQQAIRRPMTV